jgi:hypothetical protein
MNAAERYVSLAAGLLMIIGLLVRLVYVIGKMTERITEHIEQSIKVHNDIETRMRRSEQRRR